ncbi:hypothetical protein [Microbacterium sp.]|uniref:hypothetical protein n=1 Tax=Microbacterium sp. TaxID=51671 RepID=UPI003341D26D
MRAAPAISAACLVLAAALLGGCTGSPSAPRTESPSPSGSPSTGSTPTPTPTPTSTPVALPSDCRAILSDAVLAQLKDVPLNDKAFGPSGKQADGSLTCVWADPRADTTSLVTKISHRDRGPALEMLNKLMEEGFRCYTPTEGVRCEKTWKDERYPVTDGRTLFWRGGVLIDTQYSNLAPTGYTDAIVAHLWP